MQPRITQTTKAFAIKDWLTGLSRDQIADKHGISTGTVTNIIREWSAGLEEAVAEELREFVVALRKLGLTAPRSAVGARVAYMMSKIGLDEDDFYSFMSETYNICIKLGLQPERLSHDLQLLTDLSDLIPWDEIPAHIEKQIARKEKLEQEIQTLESVASEAKTRLDMALEHEAVTMKILNEYTDFRAEMNKNRILMANVPAFIKAINEIHRRGYDATSIVSKVSNFETLQTVEKELKDSVEFSTKKKDRLELESQLLRLEIDAHSQTMSKFKELEVMGFGLKEQKLLWHKIREIGDANHIKPNEAVQKFMKDVEEQYDDVLGFELKIQNSKTEIQNNVVMMQNMSSSLATQFQNNATMKEFMSSILGAQIEQLTRISGFSALINAAKGEVVGANELKFALGKAIETALGRLDANDSIVKVLETTKLALEKTDELGGSTSADNSDIYTGP
jgi:hypothetical protein